MTPSERCVKEYPGPIAMTHRRQNYLDFLIIKSNDHQSVIYKYLLIPHISKHKTILVFKGGYTNLVIIHVHSPEGIWSILPKGLGFTPPTPKLMTQFVLHRDWDWEGNLKSVIFMSSRYEIRYHNIKQPLELDLNEKHLKETEGGTYSLPHVPFRFPLSLVGHQSLGNIEIPHQVDALGLAETVLKQSCYPEFIEQFKK